MSTSSRRGVALAVAASLVGTAGCEGQPASSAVGEPIVVQRGQFLYGGLPGTSPHPLADGGGPQGGPRITALTFNNQLVLPGAADKSLGGRTTGAAAVGLRFPEMGSGYWIVPVAEPDPEYPGENAFRFLANFDADDPSGNHGLRFVAIDSSGHAGEQTDLPLCLASRIPDNLHSCVPAIAPPSVVISLRWDTNFDVDLHVITPTGVDINPKAPIGIPLDGGVATVDPKTPRIDRDSLGGCVADALRQEDLVFQNAPPPGTYEIYADPFDACGHAAVRLKLTIYRTEGTCPNCKLSPAVSPVGAELLASQSTGGGSSGLFLQQYAF